MEEATTQETLAIYYSGHEKCLPRHGFGPFARTQYLVHFILSGKGWFRAGGQVYHLEADSVFLIQPGQLTYYEADPKDPWEYCWIGFDGTDAENLLDACGLLYCPVRGDLSAAARSTICRLFREHMHNRGNSLLYKGLLYQFFSCLAEQTAPQRPAAAGEYLKKAAEYIRRNYMYDITVAGISSFVGVDRSYLYRLFRQWQFCSPQQYLLSCRMEAAQRMLLESPYTVTEIAYSCGFRDVSAFDKAFRKAVGQSPSAFRRSAAKKI